MDQIPSSTILVVFLGAHAQKLVLVDISLGHLFAGLGLSIYRSQHDASGNDGQGASGSAFTIYQGRVSTALSHSQSNDLKKSKNAIN